MTTIATNLESVRRRIAVACVAAGRNPADITLLAVSKTFSAAAVRAAAAAGQVAFGESYVQEAIAKQAETGNPCLDWHFIGPVQSNKTRTIAASFSWVHSVDRDKIAERLSAQRPPELPPLNVCLQVNVSAEASKGGCEPEHALDLARAVVTLPHLRLRGLMAIPEPTEDIALQRQRFATLRDLRDQIASAIGRELDTLSMGMSHDLEAAIMEGATIVRVGTAVFGARN